MPLAAQIMMFFGPPAADAALLCACGALLPCAAWPTARVADVTASPERKSLRFMGPRLMENFGRRRITLELPQLPKLKPVQSLTPVTFGNFGNAISLRI